MNKKIIIALLALFLAIGLLGVLFRFTDIFKKSQPNQIDFFSDQMTGQVVSLTNSLIVVKGIVKTSTGGSEHRENKTIEFALTPQTIYKKTVLTPPAGTKSGQAYKPILTELRGVLTDLRQGTQIKLLKSKENLFITSKATALEINYVTFEIKK